MGSLLGAGGAGQVYAARRSADGREVALKLGGPGTRARFEREAESLRRLAPPDVPAFVEAGEMAGHPFLSMERLEGETLGAWMERLPASGAAPCGEALASARAVADVLGRVHAAGLVHRDLKPENVFVRAAGPVALLDFGLAQEPAREEALALTTSGQRLGTVHYMAPEQCRDAHQVDARADVYSAGVILYELLTGRPPFVGEAAEVARGHLALRPPRPSSLAPVPPEVEALVLRCLAKEPEGRFDDGAALARALGEVEEALRSVSTSCQEMSSPSGCPLAAVRPERSAAESKGQSAKHVATGASTGSARAGWRTHFPNPRGAAAAASCVSARAGLAAQVPPRPKDTAGASTRRVALLGVAPRAPAGTVLGRVAPEGGALGRLQGEKCLVSFHEHPSPVAGLRAAARAARGLLGAGLIHGAVLHVAELRVRPGRTGTRLLGAALEKPEAWWVDAGAPAVYLTPEAAALLAPHEVRALTPGRFVLVEHVSPDAEAAPEQSPLLGRDSLLAELSATARRAFAEREPCLCILEGEPGQGRTRVLAAVAEVLRSSGEVRVLSVRGPAPDASGEPLSHQLGQMLDALESGDEGSQESPPFGLSLSKAQSAEHADPAWLRMGATGALRQGSGQASTSSARADVASTGSAQTGDSQLSAQLRELARTRPLALLVDDAHQADALCLDALERATLSGAQLPLWVCLAARPELRTSRPHLGDRAARFTVLPVPPLPGASARELLRELLRPVEFIPEPALAHLEALAHGNPLALVELVRALRESGAVRPDPRTGAWMLAPDELPSDAMTAPFERVVQRTRATLPHLSWQLASLCAVLGESLSVDEVEEAQRALDVGAAVPRELAELDVGAGLARLARAGVLEATGRGHYTFRHRLLRDALEADTPAPLRRALHRAALRALTSQGAPAHLSRRVAGHAAACGEHLTAARAFLALGECHRAAHRDVEAEQAYSAALAQLPDEERHLREQSLGGRGRVRSRTQRFREAIEDLSAARSLAQARGDEAAVVDLLLEEATLHDWLERPEASREAAEQAFLREERLEDPRLRLRCALARGRQHARDGRWPEAAEGLGALIPEAERLGDWESEAIARVVLGVALAFLGRVPESATCFEELIARSRARGDLLHLASAYNSRVLLWLRQQSVEPALEDLRRTVELARELGHAQLERLASFNLAEVLHWLGRGQEALSYARRARTLGERFFGGVPVALDTVLVARIAATLGEEPVARECLAWVDRHAPPDSLAPVTRAQVGLVKQLLARSARPPGEEELATWQALIEAATPEATDDELLEFLLHALSAALAAGQLSQARAWWEDARARLERAPHWKPRLAPLSRGL